MRLVSDPQTALAPPAIPPRSPARKSLLPLLLVGALTLSAMEGASEPSMSSTPANWRPTGSQNQFILSATDLFTLCLKDPSIQTDKRYFQRSATVIGTVLRVSTSDPNWPYLDLNAGAPDKAVRCFFTYVRELAGVVPGQEVNVHGIFEGPTFVRKNLPSVSKTNNYLFFSICTIERDTTTTTSASSPPPSPQSTSAIPVTDQSRAPAAANRSGLEGDYVDIQDPGNTLSIKEGRWHMHVADIDIDYTSVVKKTADKTYEFSLTATNPAFNGLKTTMTVRQDGVFIVLKETGVATETKYKKK